jgi:hypothetical protein
MAHAGVATTLDCKLISRRLQENAESKERAH